MKNDSTVKVSRECSKQLATLSRAHRFTKRDLVGKAVRYMKRNPKDVLGVWNPGV